MSASTSEPKPPVMGYPAPPPANGAGAGTSTRTTTTTTPTAYPYPAPPPQAVPYYYPNPNPYPSYPNPNPNPYYPSYSGGRSASFLRRLIILTISFLLAMGAVTFLIWLILRPRLPYFSLSNASISSFNLSSSFLSLDLSLNLTVQNPNHKLGISYSSLTADLLYNGETLAQNDLAPFYQSKRSTATISGHIVASGAYVSNDLAKGIQSDRSKNGNSAVNFQIRAFSWVLFNSGIWRTRRHQLRVYCDDVPISFANSSSSSGVLLGAPKQCEVNI